MPPAIKVDLVRHDPAWAAKAEAEGGILGCILTSNLLAVHHIGSTAIPGILAKPVLDLLPVVASLSALDGHRRELETAGYQWWGEYGLVGRRYCTRDSSEGRRLVQLHFFEQGSEAVLRHLAFRDHLREHAEIARAYEREKSRCAALHPDDSHAYADCKDAWIKRVEQEALAAHRSREATSSCP